jgi:hypothetical protein
MYRHCIFCSADLGRNNLLETFPVGRAVAFDAWKGRLWAICPRCGRWNLAPLEERWEAVEDAERLFRGARQRVHRENIGVARPNERTRLIRVGQTLPGEFAAWRYGRKLRRRLRHSLAVTAGAAVVGLGAVSGSAAAVVALPVGYGWLVADFLLRKRRSREILHLLPKPNEGHPLRRRDITRVTLSVGTDDQFAAIVHQRGKEVPPVELTGAGARSFLGRMLRGANPWGGSARAVQIALDLIGSAGRPEDYLRERGRSGVSMNLPEGGSSALDIRQLLRFTLSAHRLPGRVDSSHVHSAFASLAMEIALSEDNERRALDGELRALDDQWRLAEEIAGIADTLPDDPLRHWLSDRGRSLAEGEY